MPQCPEKPSAHPKTIAAYQERLDAARARARLIRERGVQLDPEGRVFNAADYIDNYTQTRKGKRWKFQIYVLIDPEKPELGEKRVTRGGFTDLEEAQAALTEALKKEAKNEKFQGKTPTVGAYADHWADSLRLMDSTIKGYRKIIRNHITPDLGKIRLDKLTATRIGSHYRELEKHGRKDEYGKGKPLSANSVHKVHVVLGAILDAAIDDGLISMNPAKKRRTVNSEH